MLCFKSETFMFLFGAFGFWSNVIFRKFHVRLLLVNPGPIDENADFFRVPNCLFLIDALRVSGEFVCILFDR